jgi:molecular chaperone GrpE
MSKDKHSHHPHHEPNQPKQGEEQHSSPQSASEDAPDLNMNAPLTVAELLQLQGESDRFKDMALRTQADFENYRKRAAKEKEDSIRFANLALLERLLPIIDNFELGLAAAKIALEKDSAKGDSTATALINGMSMVQKQLEDFLREQGVEVIDSVGKPFDPHIHEALGHQPCDTTPEGHVVRELRRGYKLRDRLLRPSNVFVASSPTDTSEG